MKEPRVRIQLFTEFKPPMDLSNYKSKLPKYLEYMVKEGCFLTNNSEQFGVNAL